MNIDNINMYSPEIKYFNQIKPGDIFKTEEGIYYLKLREPCQVLSLHNSSVHNAYEVVCFTDNEMCNTKKYYVYSEYMLRKVIK